MKLSDVYGCFSEVGKEVKDLKEHITVFFEAKDKLVKQMNDFTSIYLNVTLSARTKLLSLIENSELPFWESLEKVAKPYSKMLLKSDLKKIAPQSYSLAIEITGQIENVKGIAYQMQCNLKKQYGELEKMKREDYDQPLKIFLEKYKEQKHLYNELVLERDRIVTKLTALCPVMSKEAKNVRDVAHQWENIGNAAGSAAGVVLFVASLAALGYSLDSAAWQKMQFDWNALMALIGGGIGATAAVMLGGEIIKKNAEGITLFMRNVK